MRSSVGEEEVRLALSLHEELSALTTKEHEVATKLQNRLAVFDSGATTNLLSSTPDDKVEVHELELKTITMEKVLLRAQRHALTDTLKASGLDLHLMQQSFPSAKPLPHDHELWTQTTRMIENDPSVVEVRNSVQQLHQQLARVRRQNVLKHFRETATSKHTESLRDLASTLKSLVGKTGAQSGFGKVLNDQSSRQWQEMNAFVRYVQKKCAEHPQSTVMGPESEDEEMQSTRKSNEDNQNCLPRWPREEQPKEQSRRDDDIWRQQLIEEIKTFTASIANQLVTSPDDLNDAMIAVSSALQSQIFWECLGLVSQSERDNIVARKCKQFELVTAAELGVKPKFRCSQLVPYSDCVSRLRVLWLARSPLKIVNIVVEAAQAVFQRASEITSEAMGADDFMDIWIHALIRSNVPRLASTIEFVQTFAPDALIASGEIAYYFMCLTTACEYVLGLTPAQLMTSSEASPGEEMMHRCAGRVVLCERGRSIAWAAMEAQVKVVEEDVVVEDLRGVTVVSDWRHDQSKFIACFPHEASGSDTLQPSGVRCAVLQVLDTAAPAQRIFLAAMLFDSKVPGLAAVQTSKGCAIVMRDRKEFLVWADAMTVRFPTTLVHLEHGDVDKEIQALDAHITLRRLGFLQGPGNETIAAEALCAGLIDASNGFDQQLCDWDDLRGLILEVQQLLILLDLLPRFYSPKGVLDTITMLAAERAHTAAQQEWGYTVMEITAEAEPTKTPVNPKILSLLRVRADTAKKWLLGMGFVGDTCDWAGLMSGVEAFQQSTGEFVDGRISTATYRKMQTAAVERPKRKE